MNVDAHPAFLIYTKVLSCYVKTAQNHKIRGLCSIGQTSEKPSVYAGFRRFALL